MKKLLCILLIMAIIVAFATGCSGTETGATADIAQTMTITNDLQTKQPTPTDISYSLERYNLIRRAYWVNGQREKANSLPCEIEKPMGYIVLFAGNTIVNSFVVDGKVSSLNSFLTPDSEYYEKDTDVKGSGTTAIDKYSNNWIADVDGSYGENDNGIFFFTPDGKYIEWTGEYLYSDIPFKVNNPVVQIGGIDQ